MPVVWGGYFPSIYTTAVLKAPYVDFAVRGQGEDTLLELVDALRGRRPFESIRGLSFRDRSGSHCNNPERAMKSPNAFPWYPYHRVAAEKYIRPSFFGRRTAVHQASIGCPYHCNFCGVIYCLWQYSKKWNHRRARKRSSAQLVRNHSIDSVQFYDNNFFLQEDHTREQMGRLTPLGLQWWCEARIDLVLRYSDSTLQAIRRAGCRMIFFGAESGSDWVLQEMRKQLKTEQTLALARRLRQFDIIPEFSFVVGNPKDPERDTKECFGFIRTLKHLNPASEIILYPYVPVPQRDRMYGNVEDQVELPINTGRVGNTALAGLCHSKETTNAMVHQIHSEANRQFQTCCELALAHRSGPSAFDVGTQGPCSPSARGVTVWDSTHFPSSSR